MRRKAALEPGRQPGPDVGPVAAIGCVIYAGGCVFWRLNLALTPDYAARMLPGMLMTVWNPTLKSCRCNILNAISLA